MDAVLWRPPEDVFTSTELGRFGAQNGFKDYEADPGAIDAFVEFSEGRGR
jgi:hypothetical protein